MSIDILDYADFDARFARQYYDRNRPCVIRGIRERSPHRIFEWSAEYFEPLLGDTPVPVLSTTTGFLSYERTSNPLPYREFVKRSFHPDPATADGTKYYYKNPTKLLPSGHDDSETIPGLGQYIKKSLLRNLWISGPGLTVGLHFDHAENFNFQLRGRKAFTLYPPGVKPYYPLPMFSQTAHISGVFRNGPRPNLQEFPQFNPSRGVRVELRDGDVIYLPAYWWHQVESLGEQNVNLNFWWLPSLKKQGLNWNQALRGNFQLLLRFAKFGNLQKAPSASEPARKAA